MIKKNSLSLNIPAALRNIKELLFFLDMISYDTIYFDTISYDTTYFDMI